MSVTQHIAFDNSYAALPERFYAKLNPVEASQPKLIVVNDALAELLGLDQDWLRSPDGLGMLAGNTIPDGADPLAMAYAGQQFGQWSPQLGDGRALLLGELVGKDGIRRDIQLKGSGPTPFSRRGDGRSTCVNNCKLRAVNGRNRLRDVKRAVQSNRPADIELVVSGVRHQTVDVDVQRGRRIKSDILQNAVA